MKKMKSFLNGTGVFWSAIALLAMLCTVPDYNNKLDEGSPIFGQGVPLNCTDDTDGDGTADMYDPEAPAECHEKSTPIIKVLGDTPTVIPLNDPDRVVDRIKTQVEVSDPVYKLTPNDVVVSGEIFTSQCSSFVLTYTVRNIANGIATAQRRVIVDCKGPDITLKGENPMRVPVGTPYVEPGVDAVVDKVSGTMSPSEVTISAAPNTATVHDDSVVYTAKDKVGNTGRAIRIVSIYKPEITDSIRPVITLIGSADTQVVKGVGSYSDPGFFAQDNIDGNIHDRVRVVSNVDVSKIGTYTIYYNVSDMANNSAETKMRTVRVVDPGTGPDSIKPEVILLGRNPDTVLVGKTWTDPGYYVWDNRDTNGLGKTVAIQGGPVVTTAEKVFKLTYTVKDTAGNTSLPKVRYVAVVTTGSVSTDTLKPEITLTGAARCSTDVGSKYYDKGATAIDRVPGSTNTINLSQKITTTAYTSAWARVSIDSFWTKIGSYYIVYNVADAAGNKADSVKRTVYVRDTTPPPPDTIFARYGVPIAGPLPKVQQATFGSDTVYTDGSPRIAPKVTNIKEFKISWDTANGGQVSEFALSLKSGNPNYINFSGSKLTQTFASAEPKFTISGTTITGLDGSYYIRINGKYCYWVRTDGRFAVIFKKV